MRVAVLVLAIGVALALAWGMMQRDRSERVGTSTAETEEKTLAPLLIGVDSSRKAKKASRDSLRSKGTAAASPHVRSRPKAGHVAFYVSEQKSERPIRGAQVSVFLIDMDSSVGEALHATGTTDDEGRVSIRCPEGLQGLVRVAVSTSNHLSVKINATVGKVTNVELRPGLTPKGLVLTNDGDPVGGATVRAWSIDQGYELYPTVTTDDEGRFSLPGVLPARPILIIVRPQGCAPFEVLKTFRLADAEFEIRLPTPRTLFGTVTRSDGYPAANVPMYLLPPSRRSPMRHMAGQWRTDSHDTFESFRWPSATTSSQGEYRVEGIVSGRSFDVVLHASPRFEHRASVKKLRAAESERRYDIVLPAAAQLTVTIVRGDGTVLKRAQVELLQAGNMLEPLESEHHDDRTSPWRFPDVSPGDYKLRVYPVNGPMHEEPLTLLPGERKEHEVLLIQGLTLSGVVVDPRGVPQEHVSIRFNPDPYAMRGGSVNTDAEGRFQIRGLPDELGTLTVSPGSMFGDNLATLTLKGVQPGKEEHRIVLNRLGTTHMHFPNLEPGTEIEMSVFVGNHCGSRTIALGNDRRWKGSAPRVTAPTLVRLEREGFASLLIDHAPVKIGDDMDLGDLHFDQGSVLVGFIQNEQGDRIAGANIDLAEIWSNQSVRSASQGGFQMTRIPPRNLHVRVRAHGYPMHSFEVSKAQLGKEMRLQITKGHIVSGRVALASGEPAPGAYVTFQFEHDDLYDQDYDKTSMTTLSKEDSRFSMRVQAGLCRISAHHKDVLIRDEAVLTISKDVQDLKLVLR